MPRDFAQLAAQVQTMRREQSPRLQSLKVAALRGREAARGKKDGIKESVESLAVMADLKWIPGFFPTPKNIIARMLDEADIQAGQRVLEPSAGRGDIAEAVRAYAEVNLTVCEISPRLQGILSRKGFPIAAEDFLQLNGEFDRILMNPPFESGQDVQHINRAFSLLAPGGRLVAICSESPFFRMTPSAADFRALVDVHGWSERLPQGAFTFSDRPTGVNTRLVILDKPEVV